MRKTLLLAAVFAAIAMAANADGTQNFYDARGHKTGSATTIGNTTTFYDADGNRPDRPRGRQAVSQPSMTSSAGARPRPQRCSDSEGYNDKKPG